MANGPMIEKPILIVDDEEGQRESLRMIFKGEHQILLAKDGEECLMLVRKEKPSIILLDVKLPGMNGIEVLQKVKEIHPDIPIIVVSAAGSHKTVIDALKLGAVDFISKPLDVLQVRDVVRKALFQAECEKSLTPSPADNGKNGNKKRGLPTVEQVLESTYLNTIKTLCKVLVKKDPYTRQHSQEVTHYALLIGKELQFSKEELMVLEQAALLHDIGKIGVPDNILKKPGPLSEGEWEMMRQHPDIGQDILQHVQVLHIEQNMVRHHHERFDGKGYPSGLKGEEIPVYARILSIADSFHAMISDRPYRKALPTETALQELKKCSGTQFDPGLVEIFLKAFEKETMRGAEKGEAA